MSGDQQADCGGQQRERGLRNNQQPAAVAPVSNDAAIKAEKHQWPKLQRIRDAERQAGIGQLQDQPILGRDLDPRTDIGSDLCCEIDPKIAIAQTTECRVKMMCQDLSLFCHDQTSPVLAQSGKLHSPKSSKVQYATKLDGRSFPRKRRSQRSPRTRAYRL